MSTKLDHERSVRQRSEGQLLETEKKKLELTVDLGQLTSQVASFKKELDNENEKVHKTVNQLPVNLIYSACF